MRPLKDERGAALIIGIIVGIIVLAGVGGFILWRIMGAQPASDTANNTVTNAECTYEDKDICKFIAAWKLNADYKVVSTITDGDKTTTLTFESTEQGGRTHQVMNAGDVSYETVVIGDTTYTKDASDGKWWKQTSAATEQSPVAPEVAPNFEDPNGDGTTGNKVEYKNLGTEACGDKTCLKYQIVDTTVTDVTQYVWFDTQSYQLRRMRTETVNGVSDFTFSYEGVSVSEPSPTKDLPAGSFVNPTTGQPFTPPSGYDLPTGN